MENREKDLKIKALACRGADLWLNLELSKFRPGSNYESVEKFLMQRFKTDNLNPLLKVLGLLEMALIEDALKGKDYFSEEEKDQVIKEIVEGLAKDFPLIVDEMIKILDSLGVKIEEFKNVAEKFMKDKGGS